MIVNPKEDFKEKKINKISTKLNYSALLEWSEKQMIWQDWKSKTCTGGKL